MTRAPARRSEPWAKQDRLGALPVVEDEFVETDTGESYASRWVALEDSGRAGWLRTMTRPLYAHKGTEDRLVAAVGTRGCPISAEDDSLPPEVDGVWVYAAWLKH